MTSYFPRYFSQKAIVVYLVILSIVTVLLRQPLPLLWTGTGLFAVIAFFGLANRLTSRMNALTILTYEKRLFWGALLIRVTYVLVSYWFYTTQTGSPFEFDAADSQGYHNEALWVSQMLHAGDLSRYYIYIGARYSDMGYPLYLGGLYYVFGNSILLIRLLKAVLGAFICLFVYRLAGRTFNETVGRTAGVMALLMPNLIYYCGLHTKEAEMVFLTVFFFERADYLLRAKSLPWLTLVLATLLGGSLFFFRTVLGATALFSLASAIVFNSLQTVKLNRKLSLFIWTGILIFLLAGGTIENEISRYSTEYKNNQQLGMQFRSNRQEGNKLAIYGSAALFAPLILAVPFPTLVDVKTQQNQMLLNGGYFIRNILAFFMLFSLFGIVKKKQLTHYPLLLTFIVSYLLVLCQSTFALSERFHLPVLPFLLILAAHGVSQVQISHKKYFMRYLLGIALIIIGWNVFKLAGRS